MKAKSVNTQTQIISFFSVLFYNFVRGVIVFLSDKGILGSNAQIDAYVPHMLMISLSGPLLSGKPLKILFDAFRRLGEILKILSNLNLSSSGIFSLYF